MRFGIIDVGTNSIHLLIGALGAGGKFRVMLTERDATRLGEDGFRRGRLTSAAQRRALDVLRRYAAMMKRCDVERVEAVATSAVRDAADGADFVRRVRRQLGLPLRVISGREEARLIYLGVLHAHRFRGAAALIAVGGGSTQVICADAARVRYARSLPLGGARLAQQFIRHDPAWPEEMRALTDHLRKSWKPVARAMRRHPWRAALGCSATIRHVVMASYLRTHRHPPRRKEPLMIHRRALTDLVSWLSRSTARERMQLPGLDPRREDAALPTGIALLTWMEACDVSTVRYAPGSIREGLVVDSLLRHRAEQRIS